MGFDIEGARQAGYSDAEIAGHLAKQSNFDIDGATKAGYSVTDIIGHLAGDPAQKPLPEGVKPSTAGGGRGSVNPSTVDRMRTRGGLVGEGASPYVPADDGLRAGDAGQGRGFVNPGDEDRRAFTVAQVGKDLQGGVEQVKALGTGAAAFGAAVDWRAAGDALADMDAIDAGQAPRARTVPSPTGGAPRPADAPALIKAYQAAPPEQRQQLRQSLTAGLQRDQNFVAQSVQAIKAYNTEQQKLSGKMPDFTDVRSVRDFTEWAVRNGVATAPTMAVSMLGAALGVINPTLGAAGLAASSGGMALGDMTGARAEFSGEAFDPARFTNPDRVAAAGERQAEDTTRHIADNAGATAALAVPYAALDFLGPAGTLAKGAKGVAKGGVLSVLKHGAREVAGEAVNEGGQEVVNVASDMAAGERPADVTEADAKRVINAAAVGGVMGAGGHAANVATDAVRGGMQHAARVRAAEAGDVEEALKLAIEASPYGKAMAKGFHVDPPVATDPPRKQRAAVEGVFQDAAAAYGAPKAAVDAAMTHAERVPLNELPGFFARVTQALQSRKLMGQVDPDVLEAVGAGPVKPAAPRAEAVQAVDNIERIMADGAPAQPAEDFTGLADPSVPVIATPVDEAAHQAAHSPTNALPEPTDAQKEAGNYQKGHTRIGGLDIAIENPQGSVRRGTAPDGTPWETTMAAHYGYVKGTLAGDGDHSDVFIKPGTSADYSGPVFVIDQVDPKTGKFDEHKSVIGASNEAEARQLYQANYDKDWKGLGAITELPMQAFKSWVKDGTKRKPLGNIDERVGDLAGAAEQPAAVGAGQRVQPGGSGRTAGPVADDTGRAGDGAAAAPASAGIEAAPVQPAGTAHPALTPGARVELDGKAWTVRTATDKVVSIDDGAGTKRIVRAGSESWKQLAASPASTAPDTRSAADNQGGIDAVAHGEGIRGEAVGAASPTPRKAPRGGNGPLDVISRVGGISPELIADLSRRTERTRTSKSGKQSTYTAWHNPLAGGKGPVFRAGGTADLSDLARILEENGFLEPGLAERDYLEANSRVQDILKAALNGEKPLREGDADAVEREMRRRQEAAMEAAALHDQFSPEDLHDAGLSEASPAVAALTEQMLAEAEGLGVDADSLKERYYDDAPSELTDEQYHAGLQEAIRQAITEARQDAAPGQPAGDRAGDGDRGQVAETQRRPGSDRADRPDGAVRSDQGDQGLTLESHSAADLAARAERDAAAEAAQRKQQQELEDRARADAMRDEFTLTGSDRPADVAAAAGQRDIFSQPEPAPAPQPATEQRAAEPAPAPRAPRPDDVIELRKRLSVLQALKECLG